jgi:ubiquitin-small subunit ribosomal protein S27Ae
MAAKEVKGKTKKRSRQVKIYALYNTPGKKSQSCPKCGPGVFLANHKDRLTCGKCGYMEMKTSKKVTDDFSLLTKKKEPKKFKQVTEDEVEREATEIEKIQVDRNQMKEEKELASTVLPE